MNAFEIAKNQKVLWRKRVWYRIKVGGVLFTLLLISGFLGGMVFTPPDTKDAYQARMNAVGLASVELGKNVLRASGETVLRVLGLKSGHQELLEAETPSDTAPRKPRIIS